MMKIPEQIQSHFDKVRKEYHDQFELVKEPLGFIARHKVTGQSYQQFDMTHSQQCEAG